MIARLADRGEQTLARLAELPGGAKALKAMNDLRARVDELGKKVRGIDELEQRVAKLEKELAVGRREPRRRRRSGRRSRRRPSSARQATTTLGRHASTSGRPDRARSPGTPVGPAPARTTALRGRNCGATAGVVCTRAPAIVPASSWWMCPETTSRTLTVGAEEPARERPSRGARSRPATGSRPRSADGGRRGGCRDPARSPSRSCSQASCSAPSSPAVSPARCESSPISCQPARRRWNVARAPVLVAGPREDAQDQCSVVVVPRHDPELPRATRRARRETPRTSRAPRRSPCLR